MTTTTNNGDLKVTYMIAFDSFAIGSEDIVDASKGRVNSRYAREMLGVLTNAGLLVRDENEDGLDVWQVAIPGTYDDNSREEAEVVIDEWLSKHTAPIEKPAKPAKDKKSSPKSAPNTKDEGYHPCYCGCGDNVPAKSFYRPGHDARHAGAVGRAIAVVLLEKGEHQPGSDREVEELMSALPSDRLVAKAKGIASKALDKEQAKAQRAADREAAKAEKAAAKEAEVVMTEGTTYVGKNEVIARRVEDPKDLRIETLNKDGEWVRASKTASAKFVPA